MDVEKVSVGGPQENFSYEGGVGRGGPRKRPEMTCCSPPMVVMCWVERISVCVCVGEDLLPRIELLFIQTTRFPLFVLCGFCASLFLLFPATYCRNFELLAAFEFA